VFADILWRVRCEDMMGCTGYPMRSIFGFDREENQRISCSVIETDSTRILTFSAAYSSGSGSYGIALRNATFASGAGSPGGAGCEVSVQEDNSYAGACGGAAPSETQPCQVTGVVFDVDEDARPRISGQIYCRGISPAVAPTINREVTAPGDGPTAAMTPLTFTLYDCNGYTP
jgi:hypothetical protein